MQKAPGLIIISDFVFLIALLTAKLLSQPRRSEV